MSSTSFGDSVEMETEGRKQPVLTAPKSHGRGSSINGELLFAVLATCFCNDFYGDAANRAIGVPGVNVEVTGIFGTPSMRHQLASPSAC